MVSASFLSLAAAILAVGAAHMDQYGRPTSMITRRSLTSIVSKIASSATSAAFSSNAEQSASGEQKVDSFRPSVDLSSLPQSWDEKMNWELPVVESKVSATTTTTTLTPPSTSANVSSPDSGEGSSPSSVSGTPDASNHCGSSGFMCSKHAREFSNGSPTLTCLPLGWKCDNVIDCPDASDEDGCMVTPTGCPPNHLVCNSLLCVSATLRCDGIDDCGDGTDELHCPALPLAKPAAKPPGCPDGRYACKKGGCITLDALCDGYIDCPQGDDESLCTAAVASAARRSCPEGKFRCETSGDCIEASWQCDQMADCPDASDEKMCSGTEPLLSAQEYQDSMIASCNADQFKCLYGEPACISRDGLCDGHCDCVDCGDEGGACGACEHYDCEYFCRDGPAGPQCWCPEGMMLHAADGKRCSDTDECLAAVDVCDQVCYNVIGGYGCMCAAGYDLVDNQKCELTEPDSGSIVVLFNHEIRILPMTEAAARGGHAYNTMPLSTPGFVCDAELAPAADQPGKQILYYGAKMHAGTKGQVYVHRDSWACFLDNLVGLSSLAIDFITGNMYFTVSPPARRPGVGACSPDAHCAMLVVDADMPFVRSLVLEPTRARMFWIDADVHRPAIRTALMDGSRRETVINTKLVLPTGLAIDTHRQNLYWGDSDLKMIERVNLHTLKREVVISHGVRHPNDMLFFDHALYWTDTGLDAVLSVDVRNASASRRIIKSFGSAPASVAIAHPATEALAYAGRNPCASSACVHLCLLTVHREPSLADDMSSHGNDAGELVTAACACPDGYRFDPVEQACRPDAQLSASMQLVRMCADTAAQLCRDDQLCFNGGKCVVDQSAPDGVTHTCECAYGFDGRYCEVVLRAAVGRRSESGWDTFFLCLLAVASVIVCALCVVKRQRVSIYWTKPVASASDRVPPGLISWPQSALRKLDHRFTGGSSSAALDTSTVSYNGSEQDDVRVADVSRDALLSGGVPGERVPLSFDNKLFDGGERQRVYEATTLRHEDPLSASDEHQVLLEQPAGDMQPGKYHDNDSGISGNDSAIINV